MAERFDERKGGLADEGRLGEMEYSRPEEQEAARKWPVTC